MTIHRKTGSGFSNLFNEGARDKRLSWQAKGLLWFLLTEPSEVEIEAAIKENPKLFDSMIEELRDNGYWLQWSVGNGNTHQEVSDSKKSAVEWADIISQAIGEVS